MIYLYLNRTMSTGSWSCCTTSNGKAIFAFSLFLIILGIVLTIICPREQVYIGIIIFIMGMFIPCSFMFISSLFKLHLISALGDGDDTIHHLQIIVTSPTGEITPPSSTTPIQVIVQFSESNEQQSRERTQHVFGSDQIRPVPDNHMVVNRFLSVKATTYKSRHPIEG